MKSEFITEHLFLKNSLSQELYHSYAKELPILDFHNHLDPKDLAANRNFINIADAWVLFDPYKHRAMRICGIPENGITGDASDKEKFLNWTRTLPKTIGNPLFVWSALELKRIFGFEEILSTNNVNEVWEQSNKQLQKEGYGAVDILKKFNAEILCTSDDLMDDLSDHRKATEKHGIKVLPSLRGDSILTFDIPTYQTWFERFKNQSDITIKNLDDYKTEVTLQIDRFSHAGCILADHSLDDGFVFENPSASQASKIFSKWNKGNPLDAKEQVKLKSHMLSFLSSEYAKRDWTLQLHIGAQRFTSSRLRRLAGSAGGFAAIGNSCSIVDLCRFFNELEKKDSLPRAILYTLNPADYEAFATLTGSYAEDGVAGKIQFGPAWWYNDHYEGIRKQLTVLANYGILSQFIGMTTDSRSVFSFSRHEYFRRILCNQIAEWVTRGNLPNDPELLGELVKDVSYYNCKHKIFNDRYG